MPRRVEETQDPKASREVRGLRVESLRKSLRLSRRAFGEKFGLSLNTLQNWEDNKNSGLSEEGAERLIKAFKLAGIQCSIEWLLYGVGTAPMIADPLFNATKKPLKNEASNTEEKEQQLIVEELKLFREHYALQAIDFMVTDDGMEPRYKHGDYVAGLKHFNEKIIEVVGQDCILQTEEGDILLRQVKKGSVDHHFTLLCVNADTSVAKPILYDVKLLMAAPVVWMRRKSV